MTPLNEEEESCLEDCSERSHFLEWLFDSEYTIIGSLTGVKAQEEKVQKPGLQERVPTVEHYPKGLQLGLRKSGWAPRARSPEEAGGARVAGGDKAPEGED